MGSEVRFAGFSREAVQFLAELAANNDRTWFAPRKADYERLLKAPLEALCAALAGRFEAAGIPLSSDPSRSPFRIYRDTRFSRDKSPYKAHVSASFPWRGGVTRAATGGPVAGGPATGEATAGRAGGEERGGVGGYFHFQPGEMFVGGGMWHPATPRLVAWRAAVAGASSESTVHAALDDPTFVRTFGFVNGDRLKRVPAGFPPDHPDAELLKLKDVTFGRRLSDDEALSPDLPATIVEAFAAATPVLRLLAGLDG